MMQMTLRNRRSLFAQRPLAHTNKGVMGHSKQCFQQLQRDIGVVVVAAHSRRAHHPVRYGQGAAAGLARVGDAACISDRTPKYSALDLQSSGKLCFSQA